jgi:Domain of Unknown Function (DUF1080)
MHIFILGVALHVVVVIALGMSPVLVGFSHTLPDGLLLLSRDGTTEARDLLKGRHFGAAKHRTGAVYAVNYPGDPNPDPAIPPATPGDFVNPQNAQVLAWNQYRIEVQGDVIAVNLNGVDTCRYTNPDPNRGRFSLTEPTFVGLQAYSNYTYTTAFRNIRITVL